MKSNFVPKRTIVVKKSDFLKSLAVVYQDASESYITALINGLMILKKSKFHDYEDFSKYKGVIQL